MTGKAATAEKQDAALQRLRSTRSYSARHNKACTAIQRIAQRRREPASVETSVPSHSDTFQKFLGLIRQRKTRPQCKPVVPPATQPAIDYFEHARSDDPKICIPPVPRAQDPSVYARFSKTERKNTYLSMLYKQQLQFETRAKRWREYVDKNATATLDISLEHLENRADDQLSFDEAVLVADALRSPFVLPRSTSGIWNDINAKPLLAFFGERVFNGELINDGLPARMLRRKHFHTQTIFHDQPKPIKDAKKVDQRHGKDTGVMKYAVEGEKGLLHESQGLRHDCLWSVQGNPQMGLLPSKDAHSTATRSVETKSLLFADDDITGLLREMVKVAFPDEFLALESFFAAGSWTSTPLERGPGGYKFPLQGGIFLGRATLWKLQTSLHVDAKDFLCAIVCSGDFEGGEALLPDLGEKFSYRPGQVIIFRSYCLYHEVAEWKPTTMKHGADLTPGRAAYTYFTHKDAVHALKDKPPGWYKITAGGKYSIGLELPAT